MAQGFYRSSENTALRELERHGLLMQSDRRLPSVVTLVVGSPIKGSWWSHARAHDIFRVLVGLADRPDVLLVKLVSGKVTLVHRRLWPALLGVARSGEPWQTRGLSAAARAVLAKVRDEGPLRTDRLTKTQAASAKLLEQRLLVHADEVHTAAGAHAKVLESWESWAARVKLRRGALPAHEARERLERVVRELNERFHASGRLPWRD